MASGGPTDLSDRSNLTCNVCMDIYRNPKFLPCHHTFCCDCIQDWANRYQGRSTFPCPNCRKQTSLPLGGAAALQSNFYFSADDLERARQGKLCMVHSKKELEFFCVPCDQAICLSCKLTDHESHQTQDLTKAAELKKKELIRQRPRVQNAVTELTQRVEEVKKEQQTLQDQKKKMEASIHTRHATLIATADKIRDEELISLQALNAPLESGLAEDLDCLQKNLDEVRKLDQLVEQTVRSGAGYQLLTAIKEMKDGRGSHKTVKLLTTVTKRSKYIFEFSSASDASVIRKQMHDFFGTVTMIEMELAAPEETVVERFRCGEEEENIEVYSLCPMSDCTVIVSYARRGQREDAPSDMFDENGKLVLTDKTATGKVSWKCRGKTGAEAFNRKSEAGQFNTYNKSQTQTHVRLTNNLSGQAGLWRKDEVTSEGPFQTESTYVFSIKVGVHRAHDVDASEQLLAVVEEGQTPDLQRKVRMFRRPQKNAVATYSPVTAAFQPSDVCFYTLDGQHVLLVADELGDSIHVVNVQDDTMNFVRYLAPDSPLLVQPTALNVDHKGRLWVACKGGHILTVEPNAQVCRL